MDDEDLMQYGFPLCPASVLRGKEGEMRIAFKSAEISNVSLNWQKLNIWDITQNSNNEISQVNTCRALTVMSVCFVIALSFTIDFLYVNLNILTVSLHFPTNLESET